MSRPNKKTTKYSAAVALIKERPALAKSIHYWWNLRGEDLYAALKKQGVYWSAEAGVWWTLTVATPPQEAQSKTPETRDQTPIETVYLRIMAHNEHISKIVAEMTELVEALNYQVFKVYPPTKSAAGGLARAYITLKTEAGERHE